MLNLKQDINFNTHLSLIGENMDNFDWQILKTLYSYTSITSAAKELYVSQPTLTERIKRIENELHVKIITSTHRGITFTGAGEYVSLYAKKYLNNYDLFLEGLANLEKDVSGVIRIGAPSIVARYYIPLLVQNFTKLYPKVTFSVTMENSSDVLSHVRDDSFHFGFVRNLFDWDDGEIADVLSRNYLCAVSKNKFELSDLPNMLRIDYKTDPYYKVILNNWWEKNFSVEPKGIMEVNSFDLCKEMVFSGVGFAFLPSIALVDHPKVFKIILCDEYGVKIIRKTWLIGKQSVLKRKLPGTFYDFIKNNNFDKFLRNL